MHQEAHVAQQLDQYRCQLWRQGLIYFYEIVSSQTGLIICIDVVSYLLFCCGHFLFLLINYLIFELYTDSQCLNFSPVKGLAIEPNTKQALSPTILTILPRRSLLVLAPV